MSEIITQDEVGLSDIQEYRAHVRGWGRAARDCRQQGDIGGEAKALLNLGWAQEALGDGAKGIESVKRSRLLFESVGESAAVADCSHNLAVWTFHHSEDRPAAVEYFSDAAHRREALGDPLLAAKSWHNQAYVEMIYGEAKTSRRSYARADELLDKATTGDVSPNSAAFAERQRGFVYSHLALWEARYGSVSTAAEAIEAYFAHVLRTGAHREPVIVYVAGGVTAGRLDGRVDARVASLAATAGVSPPTRDGWLHRALEVSDASLRHHQMGQRRGYLGAHLLALAELAASSELERRPSKADDYVARGLALARARGWEGEEARLRRRFLHRVS